MVDWATFGRVQAKGWGNYSAQSSWDGEWAWLDDGMGVVWNCSAKGIAVEQPPGSINWCVGSRGNYEMGSENTKEWLFSKGVPVKPESLYLAQLKARLGDQAVKAVKKSE